MKPELQIKALAELDGWNWRKAATPYQRDGWWSSDNRGPFTEREMFYDGNLRHMLTSYDAIIPLIQKRRKLDQFFNVNFWKALHKIWHNGDELQPSEGDYELYYFGSNTVHWAAFDSTPAQLCEALLRAVGKWSE